MGFLKPDIESREVKSQATPLAEGVLSRLMTMLTEGGQLGDPIGPGQTAAAAGVQDFITARETPDQFLELMGPLRDVFNRQTDRAAAQTRESLGATGNRFSTSLIKEEGRLRGERGTELDAMISQLFLQDQGSLLQALGLQNQFATSALSPFLNLSGLGINPDQTIVSDSPFVTYMKLLTDSAEAAGSVIAAGAAGG